MAEGEPKKREWHLCQTPVFGSLQAELEALVLVTGLEPVRVLPEGF